MPTPLELRLHQLSIDFARRVAGIISGLTIEELLALTTGQDRTVAKPAPKKRTVRRRRPAVAKVKTTRPASTPITETIEPVPEAPPSFRVVPQPEDRAAAFRRMEQERLESAVLKFVEQNPETDAEIVAAHVGPPSRCRWPRASGRPS